MRALLCRKYGTPAVLRVEEVATPTPGPGEVLVDVAACGVNFADILMVAGKYQVQPDFPFSPGLEASGRIAALGEGVTRFAVGDRVAALCGTGGAAEAVAVKASQCVPLPDSIDDEMAAGFLVTYGTSHVGLARRARLQAGETLLVHGASGGVGITAVEIGKRMGATVIATAGSDEKLEIPASYGADHLINYRTDDFKQRVKEITGGRGVDVIYDPVGGDVFERSLRCLAWEGRLLVIGFASGKIPQAPTNYVLVKNLSVVGLHWGGYAERNISVITDSALTLLDWCDRGELKPHISRVFPLEEAGNALQSLIDRRSTGKVIISMNA